MPRQEKIVLSQTFIKYLLPTVFLHAKILSNINFNNFCCFLKNLKIHRNKVSFETIVSELITLSFSQSESVHLTHLSGGKIGS